ncbi:MAG: hypothetical protein ACP5JV_09080 [Thermus sp.]|uniref:hypothetical protein n=1 Tax=Thermus sp. TaxID=275 RepID=UPI003D0F22B9
MKRAFLGALVLLAGLSLAQQADYRMEARAALALSQLERVAGLAGGEEKLLAWAKEVKARAEKSHEAKAYFKALREAQAALLLYRAAQGEPKLKARPQARMGFHHGFGPKGWGGKGVDLRARAQAVSDRAEKELAYYRGQDPLVKDLVAEAKNRLEKEPGRAWMLARAALALISAERGF